MATRQQSTERAGKRRERDEALRPFRGFLTPGICFASGHCIWLLQFSSTPTAIEAYDEIWVITPDRERILYVDPTEAGPYVETYHEFDRVIGATITWSEAGTDGVEMHLEAEDGTTLDLRADLGASTGTRLLTAITSLTPQPVLRTSIGGAISNLTFDLLMDSNGLKVVGKTDTREPYRVEADSLRVITSAAATLNDEDLGAVQPPTRSIEFGDAIVPNEPFFVFGDLYLRPPPE